MGIDRLERLAAIGTRETAGRIAALVAELRSADWQRPDQLVTTFPHAVMDGTRATIRIDVSASVTLLVHFPTGCALVEDASPTPAPAPQKR